MAVSGGAVHPVCGSKGVECVSRQRADGDGWLRGASA
jgi:hypothetical protein